MRALVRAARTIENLELKIYSMKDMGDIECRKAFFQYVRQEADVVVIYANGNAIWSAMDKEVKAITKVIPVLIFGNTPAGLAYNTVSAQIALVVQQYLTYGGEDNARRALLHILKEVLGQECEVKPPTKLPWQGIYYPSVTEVMNSAAEYQARCPLYQPGRPTVGLLFYRSLWINENLEMIKAFIRECDLLELNVLPAFASGNADSDSEARDNRFVVDEYFMKGGQPVIEVLIDLQSAMLIKPSDKGAAGDISGKGILERLNVPIVNALVGYGKAEKEWRTDKYDISGTSRDWEGGLPEMNGIIEPVVVACQERLPLEDTGGMLEYYRSVVSHIRYLCRRVKKWLDLKNKPVEQRKVVFLSHDNFYRGAALRHDTEERCSFERLISELMGLDYDALHETPYIWHKKFGKTYGNLLQEIHVNTREFIREFIMLNRR